MKTTLLNLLIVLLVLGWSGFVTVNAETAADSVDYNEGWEALVDNKADQSAESDSDWPESPRRGRGMRKGDHGRGHEGGRGMEHGGGHGMRPGGGRGMGPGGGRGMGPGGGRGMGRGGPGASLDSSVIIEFLQKHEPALAEKMVGLLESDPQQYRRRISSIRSLYGPAIIMLEHNP